MEKIYETRTREGRRESEVEARGGVGKTDDARGMTRENDGEDANEDAGRERANEDEDDLVTMRLRLNHAFCNVPSKEYLMTTYEISVKRDGSDTAGDVKRALAKTCRVPAHALRLMWFDDTIGRAHEGEGRELDEQDTLGKHNVIRWITRFPHWCATLSLLSAAPADTLEAIHGAVAVHKGIKDVEKYIEDKRKTPEWSILQE